jgi:hypothetical protein
MSVTDPVFIASASEASIRACRALAVAAGGGKIKLPAGTITLAAALPIDSGVHYEGSPLMFTAPNGQTVPDSVWQLAGGTILQGDGTFAAFSGNTTPAGSPSANFAAGGIYNFSVEQIGFSNFTSAIEAGATNVCGLIFGKFRHLYMRDLTSYALNLVNPMHLDMANVWGINCFHAPRFAADVPLATLQPGNFKLTQMMFAHGSANTILSKGFIFEALQDTFFNEINVDRLQINRFGGTEITQTWTCTASSQDIAVTDSSKYAVGIPVSLTSGSSLGNLTLNRIYFIVAINSGGANTVRISDTPDGTPITPSTSPTPTFKCFGFPNLAIKGSAAGGQVKNSLFTGLDLEGNASCNIAVANSSALEIGFSQCGSTPYSNIVGRTANNVLFRSPNALTTDIDTLSKVQFQGVVSTGRNLSPQGIFHDNVRNIGVLSLRHISTVGRYDLEARAGNRTMYPSMMAMGQNQQQSDSTSLSMAAPGMYTFGGASSATWTLPTITDAAEASTMVGSPYHIVNAGTATITVNTSSSQLLNQIAAKTSTTVAAGASCEFWACKTAGGTLFWATRPCTAPA